jgi:acyl carrier protein
MLAILGQLAQERGLATVAVPFLPSGRNEPARRFLAGVAPARQTDQTGMQFTIAAETAAGLVFDGAGAANNPTPTERAEVVSPASVGGIQSSVYQRIATDLADVDSIVAAIEHRRARSRPTLRNAFVAPDDDLERTLGGLWQRILGIDEVSIDDNFFELCGTSLLAVEMVAELGQLFGSKVSTTSLFESTTIRAIAATIRAREDVTGLSGQRRGQRRRNLGSVPHLGAGSTP